MGRELLLASVFHIAKGSPYARVSLNNRVSVWGPAGWGAGDMTIVQAANDRGQPERIARTDLEMRLAAVGGRGALHADGRDRRPPHPPDPRPNGLIRTIPKKRTMRPAPAGES